MLNQECPKFQVQNQVFNNPSYKVCSQLTEWSLYLILHEIKQLIIKSNGITFVDIIVQKSYRKV
jgi:hypothetical protein